MTRVPRALRACVPPPVRQWLRRRRAERLQADLARFRADGTRFTPPLADFPPTVMLDITNRCNLRCAHCPQSTVHLAADQRGDMDAALARRLLDEIGRESPFTMVRLFNSGEPLLCRELPDYIAHAKQVGIRRVAITTNAVLLDETMTATLLDAGLDELEVSLDAATGATFVHLKRVDLYDRVVAHTRGFLAANERRGHPCKTTVSFVLQADNRHELDAFREQWQGRVDWVHIREFHEHHQLVGNAGRFQDKQVAHRHPCPYLWNRLIINHDGGVRFCEADFTAAQVVGSVLTDSIKGIWHGPVYTRLRHDHISGAFAETYCRTCTDWREIKWQGL